MYWYSNMRWRVICNSADSIGGGWFHDIATKRLSFPCWSNRAGYWANTQFGRRNRVNYQISREAGESKRDDLLVTYAASWPLRRQNFREPCSKNYATSIPELFPCKIGRGGKDPGIGWEGRPVLFRSPIVVSSNFAACENLPRDSFEFYMATNKRHGLKNAELKKQFV